MRLTIRSITMNMGYWWCFRFFYGQGNAALPDIAKKKKKKKKKKVMMMMVMMLLLGNARWGYIYMISMQVEELKMEK